MFKGSPLSAEDIDRLEAKIAAVEQLTSAELRIAFVRPSWLGIKRKARKIFEQHGLAATPQRNAVLVVVDFRSHEILIYGDEGVDSRAGADFWSDVRDVMVDDFREGKIVEGLSIGIRLLGEKLSTLFPAGKGGAPRRELSNAILFD